SAVASSTSTSGFVRATSSGSTSSSLRMSSIFMTRSAALRFDEAVVTVFAAIKHGELLRDGVREDHEVVAGANEGRDRLVDGHGLRRHAPRDHARPGAVAVVGGRSSVARESACTRRALVVLPLGAKLLRLVLELRDGEVDRRVEVGRLLLGEHRDVVGL